MCKGPEAAGIFTAIGTRAVRLCSRKGKGERDKSDVGGMQTVSALADHVDEP